MNVLNKGMLQFYNVHFKIEQWNTIYCSIPIMQISILYTSEKYGQLKLL